MSRFTLPTFIAATFIAAPVFLSSSTRAGTLDGLRAEHPRLIATKADFERVRQLVKTDPLAKKWYQKLRESADQRLLNEPAAEFEIPDGMRMRVGGNITTRTLTLALLYRLEPDPRYKARIWADMQAVANFPSWNPSHFLDVSMMAFDVAIAYDWLYDEWTPAQRQVMVDAIVKHGLKPGIEAHAKGRWWTKTTNNWNQVCHGGLITAALAIADQSPQEAAQMIELSVKALPLSMNRYTPNGGYEEGPSYWSYGTRYNVYGLASLNNALGHDFGLGDTPGFAKTCHFILHASGTSGLAFNYGDGSAKAIAEPVYYYFAKRYHDPLAAQLARQHNKGDALDLLWYDPALLEQDAQPLPLDAHYPKAGVITMRTAWDDKQAAYLAVKGGLNGIAHSQLDHGTFIYENKGVRWFLDFGADDYNLPGYFKAGQKGQRWTYYRNRAEGHNTLVINPDDQPDQGVKAEASMDLESTANRVRASIDLSAAYEVPAKREFEFDRSSGGFTVTDTLAFKRPSEIWWFAHTLAEIELSADGRTAQLKRDGQTLRVKLLEPADAVFTVRDTTPLPTSPNPAGQNPNNGAKKLNRSTTGMTPVDQLPQYDQGNPKYTARKLAIHLQDASGPVTIRCAVEP